MKSNDEPTSPALPRGKVEPPKLVPSKRQNANEVEEAPDNPELGEQQQPDDQVIAPDGLPEPQQKNAPVY